MRRANKKRILFSTLLFILLLCMMTISASAEWRRNANGTYSYYSNGVMVRNRWIGTDYYVNSSGVRQRGLLYKGSKWYYFDSSTGKLIRSKWIKKGSTRYFAKPNGELAANGKYKIGDSFYVFNSKAVLLCKQWLTLKNGKVYAQDSGKLLVNGKHLVGEDYYAFDANGYIKYKLQVYGGKSYFFGTQTGKMLKNIWILLNKNYYYFGTDGAMVKNRFVGRYYVDGSGTRLKNQWKYDRYLGSDGKCLDGLQKLSGAYYYFESSNQFKKAVNKTLTINGKKYKFDADGKGTLISNPTSTSDQTLLAAIIYCEAGNQGYDGQLGVGMVIANRVFDPRFPNNIKDVVYAPQQFTPSFDGSLQRALNNPSLVTASCKNAANAVLTIMKNHKAGTVEKVKINGKEISFPYLFFMTHAAYQRLGLRCPEKEKLVIKDHVFFINWKK